MSFERRITERIRRVSIEAPPRRRRRRRAIEPNKRVDIILLYDV